MYTKKVNYYPLSGEDILELRNIAQHSPMEYTRRNAINWFISLSPIERALAIPPSVKAWDLSDEEIETIYLKEHPTGAVEWNS